MDIHISRLILVLVITFAFASVKSDEAPEKLSRVEILTDSNFDDKTSTGKWLVEFYAPWCGFCKKLAPVYDSASIKIAENELDLRLGKVDCTSETSTCSKFGIGGYPTLKYIRNGITTAYENGRALENFIEFAERVSGPAVQPVQVDALESLTNYDVAFLLVTNQDNSAAHQVFSTVAGYFQDTAKFFTFNLDSHTAESVLQKLSYSGDAKQLTPPFIVLVNKKDNTEIFAGTISQDAFTTFVLDNRFGLLTELKANNFRTLTNAGKLAAIIATDPSDPKSQSYINIAKSAAKKMRQFIFVHVNGVEYSQFTNFYNISWMPSLVLVDGPSKIYYNVPWDSAEQFSEENVLQFLEDASNGKIEARGDGAGLIGFLTRNINTVIIALGSLFLFILGVFFICMLMEKDTSDQKKTN
mmetsp:Transcript_21622/g.30228  ORF Transcript_21622/g.30228 Transcript_21622/m.30228 type:complete len:413 (-) Transcript_21622:25-1263(-)